MDNHLEAWREYVMVTRGLAPTTVKMYHRILTEAEKDLGDLRVCTPNNLRDWLQMKGGKSSTFCNRASAFRSFYRWRVKTEQAQTDPTLNLDIPRRFVGIPKPVEDFEGALDALDRHDIRANERGTKPRRVGETRDMAVFIAETGLRISEACAVCFETESPDSFNIIGKGNKERPVLLTPKAREAIDRLGGKIGLSPRAIQRRFERADFHPHQLRHWRATSLVRAGVEIGTISKIMGHSSPIITMVYAQYDEHIMRDALGKVPA